MIINLPIEIRDLLYGFGKDKNLPTIDLDSMIDIIVTDILNHCTPHDVVVKLLFTDILFEKQRPTNAETRYIYNSLIIIAEYIYCRLSNSHCVGTRVTLKGDCIEVN